MDSHKARHRYSSFPFAGDASVWRHHRRPACFTGCNVIGAVLFAASVFTLLIAQHANMLPYTDMTLQAVACFGSLSMFLLFGWLYAANVFVWERCHVDYISSFSFNAVTAVHGYQALNIAAMLSVVLATGIASFIVSAHMIAYDGVAFPLSLCVVGVAVAFFLFISLPIPVVFPATRMFVGRIIKEILIGPLCYGVKFIHNYLADVMTSTCLALFELEFDVCFVVTGMFLRKPIDMDMHNICGHDSLNDFWARPVMYGLPFWIRFTQCCYVTYQARHLKGWAFWKNVVNAVKYLTCLNVVITSMLHGAIDGSKGAFDWSIWRYAWLAAIVIKTTYCCCWDIAMDWDLAKFGRRAHKKWPLLRKELMYPWTWVYYFAMVSNFFARAAWALAISPRQCPPNWRFVLAMVEIFRRAQWSLFRVENEFLQTMSRSPAHPPTPVGKSRSPGKAPLSPEWGSTAGTFAHQRMLSARSAGPRMGRSVSTGMAASASPRGRSRLSSNLGRSPVASETAPLLGHAEEGGHRYNDVPAETSLGSTASAESADARTPSTSGTPDQSRIPAPHGSEAIDSLIPPLEDVHTVEA